jgi:alginate O-acetyltransferase complex protein AlgI
LVVLAFFKYTPFIIDTIFGRAVHNNSNQFQFFRDIIVPIGLSFYTFQSIGYIVDVFRGMKPVKSLRDYFLFISFFPQLEAGPILRARTFIPQLAGPLRATVDDFAEARRRLILGFFQKVVMADNIAPVVNLVYGSPSAFGGADKWIATYGFAFQIYFDFAGYSNIAIGLAAAFGFRIPDNFNNPYFAQSFREFWQRWHISLSAWLRDYLYIPLGGNRLGRFNTYRNLMVTMLLGGLWHGANWTFVTWGALHGFYLVVGRLMPDNIFSASAAAPFVLLRLFITFHLVCLAWVFFRASSIGEGLQIIGSMVNMHDVALSPLLKDRLVYVVMSALFVAFGWFNLTFGSELKVEGWKRAVCEGFMLAAIVLFPGDKNAFIYFQF